MKRNDVFPSNYLKAEDVSGKGETYTIKDVKMETLKDADGEEVSKPVAYFTEIEKGLILNRTNWDRIVILTKEADTTKWKGKKITLRLEAVEAFGKKTDAIRVKN